MNTVGLLQDLVRIPSESGAEEAVVDHLEEVFSSLGWSAVRKGNNLFTVVGERGPLLLLNSHTDTVPVGDGWTHPPLDAVTAGGRIYGRGANDAKGCLTAMILGAFNAFASSPPSGRVCLAATCEEEVLGGGLEDLLPSLPGPDAAVVGEPTGLRPAVAQKGLVILEITAGGESAHAAWGGGTNAIQIAAEDIRALSGLDFKRVDPLLGSTTLQVTRIHGGTAANVVPDRCRLVVDVRTTPEYTPDEITDRVRRAVRGKVHVRSSRLVPVSTPVDHPVVRAALAADPAGQPFGSPTLSDWVFLKGVPAIKVGPGDSRRSHTADEYIHIEELERGVAYYERLVRSYFEIAGG